MNVQSLLQGKTFAALLVGIALASGSIGISQSFASSPTISSPATSQPNVPSAASSSAIPIGKKQPTLQLAQRSQVRRIQFEPGASSAIVKDSVVRGTQNIYLVGASKGQTMTVKLDSLEDNGVFELLTPANSAGRRRSLKVEAVSWSGVLPASGDYRIIVSGTRGNASYNLRVAIR